jgi:hypothetical protein
MSAVEALTFAQLGPHGIRVVGRRPDGMPGGGTIKQVLGPRRVACLGAIPPTDRRQGPPAAASGARGNEAAANRPIAEKVVRPMSFNSWPGFTDEAGTNDQPRQVRPKGECHEHRE